MRKANGNSYPGIEKSSISSFKIMPVTGSIRRAPKSKLTVEVRATAPSFSSTTERCMVPWASELSNFGL
jgi:hypothetical protein